MGILTLLTVALFSCNNTAQAQAINTTVGSKTTTNIFRGAVVVDSIRDLSTTQ
ncbi:MAG: hypothetical protein IPJ31_10525 [Bacteroidetes bacterium]|nr:hypothetical protein [Bacteroidota bacterium]